jgi:hypothetical protein
VRSDTGHHGGQVITDVTTLLKQRKSQEWRINGKPNNPLDVDIQRHTAKRHRIPEDYFEKIERPMNLPNILVSQARGDP